MNRKIRTSLAAVAVAFSLAAGIAPSASAVSMPTPVKVQPTYQVKVSSLHAVDESGWDGDWYAPISDEPYLIRSSNTTGTPVTKRSRMYDQVDSGDAFGVAGADGCVFPIDCGYQPVGVAGLGINISLWEHDEGNMDGVADKVRKGFAAAGWVNDQVGLGSWWNRVDSYLEDAVLYIVNAMNDDHLGTWTQTFTREDLSVLTRYGTYRYPIVFNADDADYFAMVEISRQ